MKALREFIIRLFLREKPKGVMTALPNKELVDMNIQIVAEKLMRNGIDPRSLKNANQVENAIKMIDDRPKVQEGLTSTKTAKVFDMEGKEIPKGSKIMGGKAIDDLPPPGSRGGPDDIAAPIQSADESLRDMTEAEIKKKLEKANKKGIANIKARQKMIEEAIDNVSPGFSGDLRVDADLVAEEMAKRMGKVYDDLPDLEGTRLYGEAYDALSKKRFDPDGMAQGGRAGFANGAVAPSIKLFPRASGREVEQEVGPGIKISERDINYGITGLLQGNKFFGGAEIDKGKVKLDVVSPDGNTLFKDTISKDDAINFILGAGDPRGDKFQVKTDKDFKNMQVIFKKTFNQGGRVGLKKGMDRRTFMKIMGGLATLPILGKFVKPITKAAPVVKETVSKAPDYFFALIDKIKRFGKSVDDPVVDSRVEQTYKYKNYELRENAYGEPGETIITKTDDMGEFGYKEESMRFKKGGPTEDGVVPDEYEELTLRPDREGKLKDVEDGIEDISEIIEEATKSAPPIKKAGGGIARMLGE
jgi:hypothetical protein